MRRPGLIALPALALLLLLPAVAVQQLGRAGAPGDGAGELYEPAGIFVGGGRIYVAERLNHRVGVFDLDGRRVGQLGTGQNGSLPGQLSEPEDVFVSDWRAYVADSANHRVAVFGLGGEPLGQVGAGVPGDGPDRFRYPVAVAVREGLLFVSDVGNGRVSVFGLDGAPRYRFGGGGLLGSPYGLHVTDREVYVADMGRDRVAVFGLAGEFLRSVGAGTGTAPGQLLQPRDVAVDEANGTLLVSDTENHRVQLLGGDGSFLGQLGTGRYGSGPLELATPHGVFLSDGKVYIGDLGNHRVVVRRVEDALADAAASKAPVVELLGVAAATPSPSASPAPPPGGGPLGSSLFRGYALVPVMLTFFVLAAGFTLALARELEASGLLGGGGTLTLDSGHGQPASVLASLSPLLKAAGEAGWKADRAGDVLPALHGTDVLVVAAPSKPFTEGERAAVAEEVRTGGMGLLILGSGLGTGDHAAATSLSSAFGVRFNGDLVCDYERTEAGYRVTVTPFIHGLAHHPVLDGVRRLRIARSCSLSAPEAAVLAFGSKESFGDMNLNLTHDAFEQKGFIPVMAAVQHGRGRVLCIGDYRVLSSEAPFEHARLMSNALAWLRRERGLGDRLPALGRRARAPETGAVLSAKDVRELSG